MKHEHARARQSQENFHILKLGKYQTQVDARLEYWSKINFLKRLWNKDYTLWSSKPIPELSDRLGWLSLPETMHEQLEDFVAFAEKVKAEGTRHVVLLGMGGSSLTPEVLQNVFGNAEGYPELVLLDSTHPTAVKAVEKKINLRNTLFIVSSKSGTTIETLSLFHYFWKKASLVNRNPQIHFVAITDPNTPLMKLAQEKGFRRIFTAPPEVGGRYSALTVFGLLPASLIGIDVHKFLDRAWIMSNNCAFGASTDESLGLKLGAALGELAKVGRDKATFLTSSSIKAFSMWLEQLIAESTGKSGKGIIPIIDEPTMPPELYEDDRFFIILTDEKSDNLELEKLANALEAEGHPTIHIRLKDTMNLSQQIFAWEIAVAAAGAILGINPFNQPDVQTAKNIAKETMEKAERGETVEEDTETLYTEDQNKLSKTLDNWLDQAREGDYVAIQAFLPPASETTKMLQKIRRKILKRTKLATTLGYGPRFLHSTGQMHKGGPDKGLFLQFVDEPEDEVEMPEGRCTFSKLIAAQATGDSRVLRQLGRRVLRVNLNRNISGGLRRVIQLIDL